MKAIIAALALSTAGLAAQTNQFVFLDLEPKAVVLEPTPVSRPADTPMTRSLPPDSIITKSGNVYLYVRIQQAYPDALIISHINNFGVRKLESIKLKDLPERLQKRYGYDPQKALQYEAQSRQRLEALMPTTYSNPWRDYSNALERAELETQRELLDAKVAQAAFEQQLKLRDPKADEKKAAASMPQALTPAQINALQRENLKNTAPSSAPPLPEGSAVAN